ESWVSEGVTPQGVRGWLLYDDEVEVLEGGRRFARRAAARAGRRPSPRLAEPRATEGSSGGRPPARTPRGSRRCTASPRGSTTPSSPSRAASAHCVVGRSAGSVVPWTTTTGPAGSVASSTGGRTPS